MANTLPPGFTLDQPSQAPASQASPDALPQGFQLDDEKYGSLPQQALAGAEGVARGATLGASDLAETKLGLTTPQALAARASANPITSNVGQIAGGAGLIYGTGGLGGLAEGAGAAAKIGALAAEGGVFGAGNAVSDYAMGDPSLNAQKILSYVGTGAALGAGLGILSKAVSTIPGLAKALRATKTAPEGAESALGDMEASSAPETVVDAVAGVKPTSFQDMADKVAAAKLQGQSIELPQKGELESAINRVALDNPVHPLQLDSLGSQDARNVYGAAKELPGKEGEAIRGYEAIQKNELVGKTVRTINDISPDVAPTSDAVEGGKKAIEAFTDQYQAEKKALSPIFEQLKNTPMYDADHLGGMVEKMVQAVPGVSQMFDSAADEVSILPYKTSWGIDKATYNAVKEAVESLKDNPKDFESLANIRRGLDQHVDVMAQGQAPQQIRALKAAMMDYIQDTIQKATPDLEVRQAFKRWAINEQQRQVIEKAFGASVGTPEFGAVSKIKPEMIGDKIFANTANVEAAKQILAPEKFNELLANWLSEAKAAVTDKGAFSSNKFATFLRRNQDALNVAFSENPTALQRLKDLTTISRILPDSPSINPSGTAKTLVNALSKSHGVFDLLKNTAEFTKEKFLNQMKVNELNEYLAGQAQAAQKTNQIKKMVEKVTDKIDKGAKSIFSDTTDSVTRGAVGPAANFLSSYDKNTERIQELASDPTRMMDHLASTTSPIYDAAPNIVQGLHGTLIRGVNFLNSKMPKPSQELPLSQRWSPTKSQKARFNRYFTAVDDPVSALKQVKDGTLSNETMEALQVVHPELLSEMQQKVMANINPKTAPDLSYARKIALSKFMGTPMDSSLLPPVVIANQMAYAMPSNTQSASAPRKRSTITGLEKLDLSKRVATESQDLEGSDA